MKIHPSKIANSVASEPLNKPRQAEPLKPLSDSDFAGQLQAKTRGAAQGAAPTIEQSSPMRPLTALDMIPGIKVPFAPRKPLDLGDGGRHVAPAAMLPLGEMQYEHASSRQPKTEHDKLQETARKLVAQTFYGAMLKQMRESPFKSELFSGGRGGQAFSTLLDQHLADHMSRSSGSKLVNALTRKLEARAGYAKQSTTPAAGLNNPNTMRMPHVAPSLRA